LRKLLASKNVSTESYYDFLVNDSKSYHYICLTWDLVYLPLTGRSCLIVHNWKLISLVIRKSTVNIQCWKVKKYLLKWDRKKLEFKLTSDNYVRHPNLIKKMREVHPPEVHKNKNFSQHDKMKIFYFPSHFKQKT